MSEHEPFMGWSDNLNGPAGSMLATGMGLYHVALMDGDIVFDYIPVDICVKGMIVAAWKDWKEKSENLPIYNASSVKLASMESMKRVKKLFDNPPLDAIMYCSMFFTQCKFIYWVVKIIESLIPAMILDQVAKMVGLRAR